MELATVFALLQRENRLHCPRTADESEQEHMQRCFRHMRSNAFLPLRLLRKTDLDRGLRPSRFHISARQSSSTQSIITGDINKTLNARPQNSSEDRARNVHLDDPSAALPAHRDSNSNQHNQKVTEAEQGDPPNGYVYGSEGALQEHGTRSIGDAMQNQERSKRKVGALIKLMKKHKSVNKRKFAPPHIGSARDLQGEWVLELEGKVRAVRMKHPWLVCLNSVPWVTGDRLSAEIQAFDDYMRSSSAESGAADTALSATQDSLGRGYSISLMGSRATGLETPLSDIDIGVHRIEWDIKALKPSHQRKAMHDWLIPLHTLFRENTNSFRKTKIINSRVPVLKTVHRATDLEIQIQCQQKPDPRQETTKAYLRDMPSLRPLYHVFRHALQIRDLVRAREGGIGSYPLFVMIMTALKFLGQDYGRLDLGEQLLYVLKFWAELDTTNGAYAADPPRVFNKKNIKDEWFADNKPLDPTINAQAAIDQILEHQTFRPYLLCLQDPADASHDVGRNCHHIKSIQATFKTIQDQLLRSMEVETNKTIWKLDSLLRADYQWFEWRRCRLAHSVTHPAQRFVMGNFPTIYKNQDQRIADFKTQKMKSMGGERLKPTLSSSRLESILYTHTRPFSSTNVDDQARGFRRANPLAEPRGMMGQGRTADDGPVRRVVVGMKVG